MNKSAGSWRGRYGGPAGKRYPSVTDNVYLVESAICVTAYLDNRYPLEGNAGEELVPPEKLMHPATPAAFPGPDTRDWDERPEMHAVRIIWVPGRRTHGAHGGERKGSGRG
jgi:hypothetical protein